MLVSHQLWVAGVGVAREPSALSVRDVLVDTRPTTPARLRDIDTDMEALRISRQDNPFLQVHFSLFPQLHKMCCSFLSGRLYYVIALFF